MHQAHTSHSHELRFNPLSLPGQAVTVPCDADGNVPLDDLPEPLKNAHLGARALVGWDYAPPAVTPVH